MKQEDKDFLFIGCTVITLLLCIASTIQALCQVKMKRSASDMSIDELTPPVLQREVLDRDKVDQPEEKTVKRTKFNIPDPIAPMAPRQYNFHVRGIVKEAQKKAQRECFIKEDIYGKPKNGGAEGTAPFRLPLHGRWATRFPGSPLKHGMSICNALRAIGIDSPNKMFIRDFGFGSKWAARIVDVNNARNEISKKLVIPDVTVSEATPLA